MKKEKKGYNIKTPDILKQILLIDSVERSNYI